MKHSVKLLLLILLYPAILFGQDKVGSEDHPLIQRFKQSYIYDYEVTSFDPYEIVTGKSNGSKISSTKTVEGKVYRIFYSIPTDAGSVYEIYTNYFNALKNNGAEILFNCKNTADCGRYFWDYLRKLDLKIKMPAYYGEEAAYLAGKFSKGGMGYYVTILPGYGLGEMGYEVTVVEVKEMAQQISLEGIERAINENGKVSLYGILFDTGKATLKQESVTELSLVYDYLKKYPSVKVYIVGHTDDTGDLNDNVELSNKRAAAVKDYLVDKGIDNNRLLPYGVGPYSPESSNETEEGRKKNRRVEIVKSIN